MSLYHKNTVIDLILSYLQLVFITEYMTSGSLLQFLKKAKRTKKSVTEKVRRFAANKSLLLVVYSQ